MRKLVMVLALLAVIGCDKPAIIQKNDECKCGHERLKLFGEVESCKCEFCTCVPTENCGEPGCKGSNCGKYSCCKNGGSPTSKCTCVVPDGKSVKYQCKCVNKSPKDEK